MNLDSFNKSKVSRRDVLKGAAVLATTSVFKIPEAPLTPSIETLTPIVQPETATSVEVVREEEVRAVLEKLIGNTRYQETRKLEDADGLHLFEVSIPQEDGGYVEYSYRRGRPEKNELPGWRIDMAVYDATDMPTDGHSVAKKTGGSWNLTP